MKMDNLNEITKALSRPFDEKDIEWRVQQAGQSNGKTWALVLCYITNRAIQQRLDEIIGCFNWKNEFKQAPDGGVMCGISIKHEGEWITKWDGAENTDIESVKGGLSNSMKRAAVQWGIGRYLYKLEENFAKVVDRGTKGAIKGRLKDKTPFYWVPPELPIWAVPKGKQPIKRGSTPEKKEGTKFARLAKTLGLTLNELATIANDKFKKAITDCNDEELTEIYTQFKKEG